MRTKLALVLFITALATTGCKKKGTGDGGGGGGSWFVGTEGMMRNVTSRGELGAPYDLGASETLFGIACRYEGEAWVVGAGGTLLYTNTGGDDWTAETLPTSADLRTLATQDAGRVFIAGDGVFFTAVPDADGNAEWTSLGDGVTKFRSLSSAQQGTTVLALGDDGAVWSYESGALVKRATIAGAHAIAVSPDGRTALIAGEGLLRSRDGGVTWTKLATNDGTRFEDAHVEDDGAALAVGKGGVVAMVDADGRVLHQRLGTADIHTMRVAGWSESVLDGFAGGDGGQTWLTHDGGWTWEAGPNVGATVLGVDLIGVGHR
jgi:photosystem II stability/assembly factor-like uncharacterized protein